MNMEQIKKGDLVMGKNTWTRFTAVSDPYPKLIVGTYSSIETLVVDVTGEEYRGVKAMRVSELVKL